MSPELLAVAEGPAPAPALAEAEAEAEAAAAAPDGRGASASAAVAECPVSALPSWAEVTLPFDGESLAVCGADAAGSGGEAVADAAVSCTSGAMVCVLAVLTPGGALGCCRVGAGTLVEAAALVLLAGAEGVLGAAGVGSHKRADSGPLAPWPASGWCNQRSVPVNTMPCSSSDAANPHSSRRHVRQNPCASGVPAGGAWRPAASGMAARGFTGLGGPLRRRHWLRRAGQIRRAGRAALRAGPRARWPGRGPFPQ